MIAFDNPATKNIGEDAPHSESKRSNKQEGRHNPNSECALLINPWYDIHAHFPKVSSEYLPPLLGNVWLSICRHNTEVSWVPLASSIPNLIISQGTSLPVPIISEFGSGTSLGWKEWVDDELSNKGFMAALQ